jgi:hypothetical protein
MLLATTRETVERFLAKNPGGGTLWVGGAVLTGREIDDLRAQGHSVTVLTHPVAADDEIEDAKQAISEHHPNEPVWVDSFPT